MDIHTLQTTVRAFAAVRGWPRWHTPKNLAMALVVEAAELLEIFQWLTPEESQAAPSDAAKKQHIGEEIADVQIYLLQMAEQTRVDVAAAVLDKLQRNARRYPAPEGVADVALPALPAADQPVTHVLIDYENVQPTEAQVRALVPQATRLWVFHGPHQKDMATRFASFGSGLSIVPISQTGKNALDFHLSFYMGYIAARHPTGHFVVLANDKGYEPMLEHARQLHFDVRAIGLPRGRKAAAGARVAAPRKVASKEAAAPAVKAVRKAPAKAAAQPTTKTPARKTGARKAAKPVPVAPPPVKVATKVVTKAAAKTAKAPVAPAAKTVSATALAKVEQGLRKLDDQRRPGRLARLRGVLKSLLGNDASAAAIDATLARLQARGLVQVDAGGAVTYPPR
jgi:NTP pyrophosphatase (non-canonical NTP hydrolase)